MNSLLDGARRCLSLARGRPPVGVNAALGDDLELAGVALERMSVVLERAMRAEPPGWAVFSDERPLAQSMAGIVRLCGPLARQHGVRIECGVDDTAGRVPTGVLEPVLMNGLRNAIVAAGDGHDDQKRVEVAVSVRAEGELEICIADTGPGPGTAPRSGGHGLGLELCRQITAGLAGTVDLAGAPYGRGTILRVRIPLNRLGSKEPAS